MKWLSNKCIQEQNIRQNTQEILLTTTKTGGLNERYRFCEEVL